MRDYEMVRRPRARAVILITVAAVGVLVVLAAPAGAKKPTPPARAIGSPRVLWSESKFEQGIGEVQVAHGRHRKDQLDEVADLGPAAFDIDDLFGHEGRAVDWVHSLNPDGTPIDDATYRVQAQTPTLAHRIPFPTTGGDAHLDWTQAYDKRSRDATLRFRINDLKLNIVDDNGPLVGAECPALTACDSIRAFVRYHLRAWTVAGGREFFDVGGGIFGDGHEGSWLVGAATSVDSGRPFWTDAVLTFNRDFEHDGKQSHLVVRLVTPTDLEIPLKNVQRNAPFEVHLTMDAIAIDDRGRESAASAYIQDPQHAGGGLVAHGLAARAAPTLNEPPVRPRPAARCPGGPRAHAGTLQFSRSAYTVDEANDTPLVLVSRGGGSRGATSAILATSSGSAVSGRDFTRTRTVVRFENGDDSPRLVEIPIREDRAAESSESFTVSLAHVQCSKLGKQRSAAVTILDDDQPPPPPEPTFTIGGTVDGLQGSGLVLSDFGAPVSVSANGSFTFPGTAVTDQSYKVNVITQPTNPDQICTVDHGTGQVGVANVTDIAVHCATQVLPSGLDSSFGDAGRVTTPGSGDGRAVLIQPDGKIVTIGLRDDGQFRFDFAAIRHNPDGTLDTSFGAGGIATTDLGGNADKARDAALLRDGGFVAVGQADPAGLANIDFGLVRYTADGHPDPSFNGTGIETTDIAGHDDTANAVAVQPDGKIVVAGAAFANSADSDFGLARYNPDGTLDSSFGRGGIVTTDLGTFDDSIADIALQPDGKIVAVGAAFENAALARYLPDGRLDPTFGNAGTVIGGLGTDQFSGIAVTPGGTILLAGTGGGPKGTDVIVASYGPTGKLNLGFGNFGVAQADLSGQDDFGNNLVLDANGNIVLVGSASTATLSDMALVRFKPDGTIDTTLTVDFHGKNDFGNAVTIDPQGRIVAAGTSGDQFALMRATL